MVRYTQGAEEQTLNPTCEKHIQPLCMCTELHTLGIDLAYSASSVAHSQ